MVDAVPNSLVVVARDLLGEHVLARVLVAAVADEALLVAVIDGRHAAQQEQHRVGQHHALQHLVVAGIRPGALRRASAKRPES